MESNAHIVYVGADATDEIAERLRTVGDELTVVETVAGCLAQLSTASCIVISDAIADGDPVSLCSRIRAHRSSLPVIVYPADGTESLAGDAIAAGADGYVPRSDGLETLTSRVRDRLEAAAVTAPDESPEIESTDGKRDPSPASDSHSHPASAAVSAPVHVTATDGAADPSDRLELLVDQSPLAIIEWTLEFEVASWNPAATELFGYTPAEARGEDGPELLVPADSRADVRDHWRTLTTNPFDASPTWNVSENVRKDGATITCEWYNTPIVDDEGELVSVLSFVQDVTAERKRANALEALQETTNELMRAESVDEIAAIVIRATEEVIDRSLAALRLYDEETDALELAAVTEQLDANTGDISRIGPENRVLWEAYTDGEPFVVEDVRTERIPYDIDIEVGKSILYPLGEHGMLSVASSGGDELDAADLNLVHVLAATAEAALDRAARERELERTETIVETVGDSVYALDYDGRLVTVNDRLSEMTGYERDELVGEHVSKILTDASLERGRKRVRALAAADEDRVATYEITLVTRDGESIPCEVNTTLLQDDETLEGSVGVVRDISDRKRMERELVERKAKIESLHEVASRLDDCETRGEIYDRTVEAAEEVLNFDVCVIDRVEGDSLVKAAVSSRLEGEGEFDRRTSIDEGIAGRTYRRGETYRIADIRDDSDAVPQNESFRSVLSVPIADWGIFQTVSTEIGAFTREDEELAELLLSHVTDALDRIAYEDQLRAERDRFAALFENVPDAVVSARKLEEGALVESVNPAFERIFGYDEETLVDEPLDEFIVPADEHETATAISRRGGGGESVEAEVKRRTVDGLRDFMLRVVPVERDESTDRAFGLYTDITDQKQRQKRVEILNRVLRHDMRNGMNIIDGCAEMLAEAVEDDDIEYATTIQERASELVSLAEKTRAVERVLERESTMAGPVDVTDAVRDAVGRLEETYPGADVRCSLPDRLYARADASLQTALYQVLENAVEHTDRAEPTIEVTACDRSDDGMLSLSVADDGPGMPDEERELLEGDREITQLRHASGLGLWLVNLVVTQSGGQLRFAENEPRGTVVTLEVPRADTELRGAMGDEAATGD